ncbi:unnamed protein product [Allacma fusca]|uniref:Uncharacterized protein n=1 Tax=Allacma fusca TaxID=39272 RepID=A0A8J2JGK7_9HEXA|nr:unnamed protein product [Allacma fusca]
MVFNVIRELSSYGGSTSLNFLSQASGIPIDQVNFIFCQLVALFLSFFFKAQIKKAESRLWFCLLSGIVITVFCFGSQIGHIILMGGLCYATMNLYQSSNMPWAVTIISMTYMSVLHLKRQFLEPGNYSLDITGPMMVLTQKVSSLAFSVRDGRNQKKSDVKLTELQTRYAVERKPSFFEFTSFTFQFQSMLAGPLVMYKDFHDFIITENVPSSAGIVARKLVTSVFFAVVFVTLGPFVKASTLTDHEFLDNMYFINKVIYIICVTTIERTKYHHAWILADAVCNASGLGYDHTKKTWDLTTNVRPFDFECGLSFKETLDHWNIGTGKWLRHIIYERVHPNIRTVLTYMVSAMWHGFYPGYYITFLTGALITSSARTVRRHIRPYFTQSSTMKTLYDISTWTASRVAIAYCTFTFILLEFEPGFVILKKIYFFLHILCLVAILAVPKLLPATGAKTKADNSSKNSVSKHATTNGNLNDSTNSNPKVSVNGDAAPLTNKINGFSSDVPASSTKLKTG